MSTRSDSSQEGLNESHINDTERSKWFWRWKWSDDTGFRVAVMKRMECECIATGDTQVNSLNDFSWTYRRHWRWIGSVNPKDGWCDGPMVIWPVNGTTQPGSDAERKCHVQEQLATSKVFSSFLPNFHQSLLTSTSLFLSSLRRITYACSIICPSGKPVTMF